MSASRLPKERQDLIAEVWNETHNVNEVKRRTGHSGETIRRIVEERKLDPASVAKSLDETIRLSTEKDRYRAEQNEARKLLAAEARMRRYLHVLEENLQSHEPTPLVLERETHSEDPTHPWVLALSDWHVGQKTREEETGGIYYQDIATTRKQVAKIWNAVQLIHQVESKSRHLPELHVLNLGDLIDGDDMRPSQHRKVEEVVTKQVIAAFDLLDWLIGQLLTIFPVVYIDGVGGNHDRLGPRRGDAGLGELDYIDTYAWLMMAFLERSRAKDIADGRLKLRNWETFFGYKEVAGQKLVFEHGSSFKWGAGSYGGVPWYGVHNLGPRYESMLGGADVIFLGHGHRPALLPKGRGWICSNGALPASSTYAQSSFKTISRPVQWLLSLHEEHGVTGFHPIYAEADNALLPGQIWEDPEFYADIASGKSSS